MSTNGKVTVVIADDHAFIRLGIRNLLEKSPIILIVGEACNGQEAIHIVEDLSPDILILDLQMPIMDGFQALEFLHKTKANLIILVLSANNDPQLIAEIKTMGAWGYYKKEEAPEQIVEAVHQAFRESRNGNHPE